MISQSEDVLEDAMLSQTKQQAVVFLQSVEDQLQQLQRIPDKDILQNTVARAKQHSSRHQHSFIISSLYIYDTAGKVVAHSNPGIHADKDLSGHYGKVLRDNAPYIGNEVEYEEGVGGQSMPKVDVIIPLVLQGAIFGGIEAELDLRDTMQLIKQQDNIYKNKLLIIVTGASIMDRMGLR